MLTPAPGNHGFIRHSDGTFTQLDVPGAFSPGFTLAYGIDDTGHVVGWFADVDLREHGFVYDGNTYTIFDVPGAVVTEPHGIDACGRIVGRFVDTDRRVHGFIKDDKKFTTIDFPGAVMTWVSGISQTTGLIVGHFINELPGTSDQTRGFLAKPAHGRSVQCHGKRR